MKGASTEAAPAGNRGLTNVTNKESTMAASQHTRTSDGAGNIPPLVASINAHCDGRDPAHLQPDRHPPVPAVRRSCGRDDDAQ